VILKACWLRFTISNFPAVVAFAFTGQPYRFRAWQPTSLIDAQVPFCSPVWLPTRLANHQAECIH